MKPFVPTPLVSLVAFTLIAAAPSMAAAQGTVAPDAGCVQERGVAHCNWSSFKLAFERAHTVRVQADAMDRPTVHQVDHLLAELGKTQAPEGGPADLTFAVFPSEPTGVNIGPADHDLATLRIYAPASSAGRGLLLWAETLHGQGDRPWPAQVHALLSQFQDRFAAH